ncbi:MAG: hypothetical protein AAF741_17140 [Bacteroidota bacterium]
MIRWLGIHYKFPPVATVSSRRLYLLYKALSELTEEQVVVTSAEAAKRPTEAAFFHNFRLSQVGGRGIREWLYGAKHNVVPSAHKQRPGYDALVRLRETSPFDHWLGEGGPTYKKLAYRRAAQLVEQERITHLFSSFRPWVDHQVAAKLKQRYPHLHWIADFRDLPMDPLRSPPYGLERHKRLLKDRLAYVDELWTVSEGLADQFKRYHDRVKVVYGGLDELPKANSWQSDRFTINYSGSIYPDLQVVSPLLACLERLTEQGRVDPEQILIRYAGRDRQLFADQLSKTDLPIKTELNDTVSMEKAKGFQQQTHINLLLSWSTETYRGVLTAKLYDYLAAGRPILALVNGPDDPELKAIIEGSESGKVFFGSMRNSEGNGSGHLLRPGESLRPAEVYKEKNVRPDNNSATLDEWLLKLYDDWSANNGALSWKPKPEMLKHLQPLPILERLLRPN